MAAGRETIKQRITLEGGKEIQEQLEALGKAGEQAFDKISRAALKTDLARFGKSLNTFGRDLATVGRRAALAFGAISTAAGAAGAAMFGLAKSAGEAADQVGKAAQKTGLQVEAFQKLAHAAEMSDVGQEEFVAGMSRLNRAIAEAAEEGAKAGRKLDAASRDAGRNIVRNLTNSIETFDALGVTVRRFGDGVEQSGKKAEDGSRGVAAAFARLGVSIRDANGTLRSNQDILFDLASAFSKMPDGAEKSALAMEIFGRAGAELLPFLNEGAAGIRKLGDDFVKLGGVFTSEQTKIGDALGDALDEVGVAVRGLRNQVGILFAPALTQGANAFRDLLVANREAVLDFGRAAEQYGTRVVQDLINALQGRDAAVENIWILEWRDAIVTFGNDVRAVVETVVVPLFNSVRTAARTVADAINAAFGTDISAGQLVIGAALLKLLGIFRLVASGAGVLVAGLRLIGSALAVLSAPSIVAGVGALFTALRVGALGFLALIAPLVGWPALIVAGVAAAGTAIVVFWDDIVAGAQGAIGAIAGLFSPERLSGVFAGLREGAAEAGRLFVEGFVSALSAVSEAFIGLGQVVAAFSLSVVQEVAALAQSLLPSWDAIRSVGSSVWSGIATAATAAWDTIVGGASAIFERVAGVFSAGVELVRAAFQPVADIVASVWASATDGIAAAAQAITETIQRASEIAGDVEGAEAIAAALVEPFIKARDRIGAVWGEIRNFAVSGVNAVLSEVRRLSVEIDALISRILAALQAAAAAAARLRAQASGGGGSSGGGLNKFAGGGHVRGPGTATSDSIPAWLSSGEFVVRAAAVRKFGVGFFDALNSLRLPKGFSLGGLVGGIERSLASIAMPPLAMAAGGLVPAAAGTAGRPVNITLDGRDFALVAADDVAEKLARAARGAAVRSAGRRPGWYR